MWKTLLSIITVASLSHGAEAILRRRDVCDKEDTFFKHRHVYSYKYTATTSSSFDGTTASRAGFKLSCSVDIKVPRRCKHILELSGCGLQKRQEGPDDVYISVDTATEFLQSLERYLVHFEMNNGVLTDGSIYADQRETIQALNVKRGIISSLQFQIREVHQYSEPIVQRDIFGDCPTQYSFSTSDGNHGHTSRNLRECHIRQIFRTQFNAFSSMIRPESGGLKEGPISEGIYPFHSGLDCKYSMNSDQLLEAVDCLQQQYFKPATYQGDILATAMTNISQNLVLIGTERDRLKDADLDPSGYVVTDVRFDFGDDHSRAAEKSELAAVMTTIVQKHASGILDEVPGIFGEFVQLLRHTSAAILEEYRSEVFSCYGSCDDVSKDYGQRYFVDGLHSCGTEACILTIVEVLDHGHLKSSQEVEFYHGLSSLEDVPESVIDKLWIYCDTSGKTSCWLTLGTILSKTKIGEDSTLPTESTVVTVLEHTGQLLEENCQGDGLSESVRRVKTAIKTLENIGFHVSGTSGSSMTKIEAQLQKCLSNEVVPKSVKRSIVQVLEEQAEATKFKVMSQTTKDTLFTILEDVSADAVLRTRCFSLLMKTTDKDTMRRLLVVVHSDQTTQMKAYMSTALRTLLENDQPDMREIKAAWHEYRKEKYFSLYVHSINSYSYKYSKAISFADFFKLPLTEYFGEQLYIDVVFDPAMSVFSGLHLSLNFFYGNNKNPLFDMDLNIYGFDTLVQLLASDKSLSFEQLHAMFKAATSGANIDKAQFAAFQKDIVDAVLKILETANHPKLTDFDLELDLKFQGKNVLFLSLQEVLDYVHLMQQHMATAGAGSSSSLAQMLNKILDSLEVDAFKTVEFASLTKVLPTCVGFPMNMSVRVVGQNQIRNTVNLNMPQSWRNIDVTASTHMTFKNEMKGQLIIPIGLEHEAGMRMKIQLGSERDGEFVFAYDHSETGHVRAEFKLFPLLESMDSERLLHARGQMFILHDGYSEEVLPDLDVQTEQTKCMSDKFQMILGRSLCATVRYPDVRASKSHAYFPLSGPFDVEVIFAKVDNVISYSWVFETYKNQPGYDEDTRFVNLIHTAQGDLYGRNFYFNITANPQHRIFNISSGLPMLEYVYYGQYADIRNAQVNTFELSENVWISGKPFWGYSLKGVSEDSSDAEKLVISTEFTLPGVSWELQFEMQRSNIADGGQEHVYDLTYKWFCSKERPLLYLLHPSPTYAAKNGDVTKLGLRYIHTETEGKDENEIHLKFYDSVLKATLGKNFETNNRDIGLAYEYDGIENVIIGAGTLNDYSSGRALFYDCNLDVNNEDYNMVLSGNVKGHHADVTMTADIQYTNKQDGNEVTRRKRSLNSIYEHFVELKKAASKEIKVLTDGLLGGGEVSPDVDVTDDVDGSLAEEAGPGGQLPNMIPTFPSIWDLPSWNTTVNLNAKLQPKFSGPPGPYSSPVGMELVISTDVTHPWNGGYRILNNAFTIGKSRRAEFRYFWFWIDNEINATYTALDGTPIMDNGKPLMVRRGGNFNVFRESGDRFEFRIHQFSPALTMTYEILFDWDAYGHEDPLFHVFSYHQNALIPFLNHNYTEYFTYEMDHIKHSADFKHSMLNVSTVTDFYPRGILWMVQSANVSLIAFDKGGTVRFKNEATFSKKDEPATITSKITLASMPGKTLVYSIGLRDPRTIFISGAIIPAPEASTVPLWNIDVALVESTLQQVTFTWTPAFHERMTAKLRTMYVNNALALNSLADQIGENMDKPLADQTVFFIGATPRQLMKKYVFPRVVMIGTDFSHVMANFVSLKERQAILDNPGPKVPPRFRQFLGIIKASEGNKEPNSVLHGLQKMDYYALKGLSTVYLALASQLFQSKAMEQAIQKREMSVGWTNWFIMDEYGDFPENVEAIKHILEPLTSIFSYYRYYYGTSNTVTRNQEQLAVIFGRHDQSRPMNVMTFDKRLYEIPAEQSSACIYLLAADLINRKYALVMSPQGLTLLTSDITMTISYDDSIYLGDSKTASDESEIEEKGIVVKRLDDRITIDTEIGVSVVCYTVEADVCLIGLKGGNRNSTIGLLGTNDEETFLDWRLLDGQIADNLPTFLADYVVSGPDKCFSKVGTEQPKGKVCSKEFERACFDQFYKQYSNSYKCGQMYSMTNFREVCTKESHRCDAIDEDKCYTYRAFASLCERSGLVDSPLEMSDICDSASKPPGQEKSSKGSLDVVFVVSDHESMLKVGSQPWQYIQELLTADSQGWDQFEEVRIGMVGFAGAGDKLAEHIIWQTETAESYFTDMEDIDWSRIKDMSGSGSGTVDGFQAIRKAASFPFSPTSHKLMVLLITKEQGSGNAERPQELLAELKAKGIVLNIFSTYAKVSSRRVIGINWEEKVITRRARYEEIKALPKNDYVTLMQGTKGALWDLDTLKGGRKKKVLRVVDEFVTQME